MAGRQSTWRWLCRRPALARRLVAAACLLAKPSDNHIQPCLLRLRKIYLTCPLRLRAVLSCPKHIPVWPELISYPSPLSAPRYSIRLLTSSSARALAYPTKNLNTSDSRTRPLSGENLQMALLAHTPSGGIIRNARVLNIHLVQRHSSTNGLSWSAVLLPNIQRRPHSSPGHRKPDRGRRLRPLKRSSIRRASPRRPSPPLNFSPKQKLPEYSARTLRTFREKTRARDSICSSVADELYTAEDILRLSEVLRCSSSSPPRPDKSPNWRIRGTYLKVYVDKSSGTHQRSVARAILNGLKGKIERGEYPPRESKVQSNAPTFLSAAVAYLEAGRRPRYVARLIRHFGETPLSEIDQAAIDAAAVALHPDTTPGTRNSSVYTPTSAILRHAGVDIKLRRPKGAKGRIVTDYLTPATRSRLSLRPRRSIPNSRSCSNSCSTPVCVSARPWRSRGIT